MHMYLPINQPLYKSLSNSLPLLKKQKTQQTPRFLPLPCLYSLCSASLSLPADRRRPANGRRHLRPTTPGCFPLSSSLDNATSYPLHKCPVSCALRVAHRSTGDAYRLPLPSSRGLMPPPRPPTPQLCPLLLGLKQVCGKVKNLKPIVSNFVIVWFN